MRQQANSVVFGHKDTVDVSPLSELIRLFVERQFAETGNKLKCSHFYSGLENHHNVT